jgi:aspartate/methionine/tyrosine aminotransferase
MTFKPAERLRNVTKSATRRLYDAALPGSINLGLGEPDFKTPDVIRAEACRVINEEHNGYTMNAGLLALRERIAEYHCDTAGDTAGGTARDTARETGGQKFTAANVCVTSGVEEGLFASVLAIAGPADEVLLPNPCFLAYPSIGEIAGASVTYYRMPAAKGFAFDADEFDRAVTDKTRLVLVLSPSNPTGRVLAREDLKHIADRLAGSGVYILSDEIYRELYFKDRPASIAEYYPNTIVLSGLSKMMSMTGWRLGWVVGPLEVVSHVTVMHQYACSCASTISQKAGIAAFTREAREATEGMRDELRWRGQAMARAIEREIKLPYVLGEGAFYIMLKVAGLGRSDDVAMALLEDRVITTPGGAFGSEGEGYLRLSFSIEPALIEEGIMRVARGLARLST